MSAGGGPGVKKIFTKNQSGVPLGFVRFVPPGVKKTFFFQISRGLPGLVEFVQFLVVLLIFLGRPRRFVGFVRVCSVAEVKKIFK